MKTIKTLEDLDILINKQKLSQPLHQHLQSTFLELHQSLEPETKLPNFSLERHGYLVLLESEDDVRNLSNVGLIQGLLESSPEWVELKELPDGHSIYQIAILYNNDYLMLFYCPLNTFGEDVENWLNDQL